MSDVEIVSYLVARGIAKDDGYEEFRNYDEALEAFLRLSAAYAREHEEDGNPASRAVLIKLTSVVDTGIEMAVCSSACIGERREILKDSYSLSSEELSLGRELLEKLNAEYREQLEEGRKEREARDSLLIKLRASPDTQFLAKSLLKSSQPKKQIEEGKSMLTESIRRTIDAREILIQIAVKPYNSTISIDSQSYWIADLAGK